MKRVYQLWKRSGHMQNGQTMAEYALIVALVAIIGLAAWSLLGTHISTAISNVAGCV